jgi:hypothetical protein
MIAVSNWNFVAAGYALATVTLVSYATSIKLRARRLRRSLGDDERA